MKRVARVVAGLGLAAGGLTGCADDCVDRESAVVVTVEGDGTPIIATVDWSSDSGESGSLDCDGSCEIRPDAEGTVELTVEPVQAVFGEAQTDTVDFFQAQDDKCEQPVYSYVDFSFTTGS